MISTTLLILMTAAYLAVLFYIAFVGDKKPGGQYSRYPVHRGRFLVRLEKRPRRVGSISQFTLGPCCCFYFSRRL